jgi:hypothetical protein
MNLELYCFLPFLSKVIKILTKHHLFLVFKFVASLLFLFKACLFHLLFLMVTSLLFQVKLRITSLILNSLDSGLLLFENFLLFFDLRSDSNCLLIESLFFRFFIYFLFFSGSNFFGKVFCSVNVVIDFLFRLKRSFNKVFSTLSNTLKFLLLFLS